MREERPVTEQESGAAVKAEGGSGSFEETVAGVGAVKRRIMERSGRRMSAGWFEGSLGWRESGGEMRVIGDICVVSGGRNMAIVRMDAEE